MIHSLHRVSESKNPIKRRSLFLLTSELLGLTNLGIIIVKSQEEKLCLKVKGTNNLNQPINQPIDNKRFLVEIPTSLVIHLLIEDSGIFY